MTAKYTIEREVLAGERRGINPDFSATFHTRLSCSLSIACSQPSGRNDSTAPVDVQVTASPRVTLSQVNRLHKSVSCNQLRWRVLRSQWLMRVSVDTPASHSVKHEGSHYEEFADWYNLPRSAHYGLHVVLPCERSNNFCLSDLLQQLLFTASGFSTYHS